MNEEISECSRTYDIGELTVDTESEQVWRRGDRIRLPHMEYELLMYLIRHPDRVFTKEELILAIWGYECLGQSATLTVHINRLRKKLEPDIRCPTIIETVWGVGYKLSKSPISQKTTGCENTVYGTEPMSRF